MQIKLKLVDIAEFVGTVENFKSDIDIRSVNNGIIVDAKSIISVLALDLGSRLLVNINSSDIEEIDRFNKELERYEVRNAN